MASLFVSDLHLDASAPWAIETFIEFVAAEARSGSALYILGDLFEAWVGDDQLNTATAPVLDALRALTGAGVRCYLLHGNRDFLIGAGFTRVTGVTLLPDPVVATIEGTPTMLTHGDLLCVDDHSYQELRSIVRQPHWQRRFLALPYATRAMLADEARAGSKAHTQRVAPDIMDVNPQAVIAAFRATDTRRMIHGHTHRPAVHKHDVDGKASERIVLDAWYERASYLRVEPGSVQAVAIPRR
jgi:UDP-2,3-diacylglucosamine hydrolase